MRIYSRRGLIFHVAARMAAVISAADDSGDRDRYGERCGRGPADRTEGFREGRQPRRGLAAAKLAALGLDAEPELDRSRRDGRDDDAERGDDRLRTEAKARAAISGAKTAPIAISTTSILARITRDGGSGAVATRSAASSPDIVSQARPPASCPAAITITGVISTIAAELSEKLRHSIRAGGTR